MRVVVDTNVPIVANGRPDPSRGSQIPAPSCQLAAVNALILVVERGTVVLDYTNQILSEYARHLNPSGQPGTGDLFLMHLYQSIPGKVDRVDLPLKADGDFQDFPTDPALQSFDRSDRKFAALSRRERIPVLTATDTDWLQHRSGLEANGVSIDFVCGCDKAEWFT